MSTKKKQSAESRRTAGSVRRLGRGKPVTGKQDFEGIDTGEVRLPNGGKMRMIIGAISITVESE